MSRRKRGRYCAPIGLAGAGAGGVVSVAMSVAAGGDTKSFTDDVHSGPPWQAVQPCWMNSRRPAATSDAGSPPRSDRREDGPAGVRTALRTHSRSALRAGIATPEPGSVIVCCARSAFGLAKPFSTQGGLLMSPLSPMSRPWFGSSVDVAGGGVWQATAVANGPGPDTLLGLKVALSGTDLRGPVLNCQTTPSVRPLKWQLEHDCQPSEESRSLVETVAPAGRLKLPRDEKKT